MSEVKVPEMGESIMEGTIAKWHVKEGDNVNQGDVLAELETDKVNIEISAEESGIVAKLLSKKAKQFRSEKRSLTRQRCWSRSAPAAEPAPVAQRQLPAPGPNTKPAAVQAAPC